MKGAGGSRCAAGVPLPPPELHTPVSSSQVARSHLGTHSIPLAVEKAVKQLGHWHTCRGMLAGSRPWEAFFCSRSQYASVYQAITYYRGTSILFLINDILPYQQATRLLENVQAEQLTGCANEWSAEQCEKGHLVFLDIVLTGRVGLGLAIDCVILVPAASMVAAGTFIRKVAEAPVQGACFQHQAHCTSCCLQT